jgi:hypothetical protein
MGRRRKASGQQLQDLKRTLLSGSGVGPAALRAPVALVALVSALALVPLAAAHGVPKPDADVRLLQDWTDDCGGDGGAIQGACKGSNDLIALDLIEKADAAGDLGVFRLFMDKGQSGTHDVSLSLSTPNGGKSYTLHSTDDAHFSGSGLVSVGNAVSLNDGTRFSVDAAVRLSDLGGPGAKLSGFKVEAKQNGAVGDFMPGGCHNKIGDCQDCPPAQQTCQWDNDGGRFVKPDYTLRGPTYYITLKGPDGSQHAEVGTETLVQVEANNEIQDTPQDVHFAVSDATGVRARFHNPSTNQYTDTYDVSLPQGGACRCSGKTFIHLTLNGETGGASGILTVTATTTLGGRTTVSIPYTVAAGQTGGVSVTDTIGSGTHSKGSPLPAGALVALALLGSALLARRRA